MSETQKIIQEHHEKDIKDQQSPPRTKNLRRHASIEKFMFICHQSYQVFPYIFLCGLDFQTSIHKDITKMISLLDSFLALRLGVYLSIALLSAELTYCLSVVLSLLLPAGSGFFLLCIGILSAIAFQIFDVALGLRKKLRGSFFVKKKIN